MRLLSDDHSFIQFSLSMHNSELIVSFRREGSLHVSTDIVVELISSKFNYIVMA